MRRDSAASINSPCPCHAWRRSYLCSCSPHAPLVLRRRLPPLRRNRLRMRPHRCDPCQFLDADAAETLIGQAVDAAEEHLTWMPGFRSCVFFDGDDYRADVSVRQAESNLDDAARLMDQLGDALPVDAEHVDVTGEVGQPARAYAYCVSEADCTWPSSRLAERRVYERPGRTIPEIRERTREPSRWHGLS